VIAVYLIARCLLAWVALPKQEVPYRRSRACGPAILVAFAGAVAAYLLLPHHLKRAPA